MQRQQAQVGAATVARFAHIQADIRIHVAEFTETARKLGDRVEHLGETLKSHAQAQDERMQMLMGNLEAHVNYVEVDEDEIRRRLDQLSSRVRKLEEERPSAA